MCGTDVNRNVGRKITAQADRLRGGVTGTQSPKPCRGKEKFTPKPSVTKHANDPSLLDAATSQPLQVYLAAPFDKLRGKPGTVLAVKIPQGQWA
jgi:hypothetical protein